MRLPVGGRPGARGPRAPLDPALSHSKTKVSSFGIKTILNNFGFKSKGTKKQTQKTYSNRPIIYNLRINI